MGGDTVIEQAAAPVAPKPSSVAKESIEAQVAAIPDIFQAQKEFGPQFTQLELEQLKQFGPQFAREALDLQKEFGPQVGEALRAEQEAAQPELASARRVLTQFLDQPELLSPEEKRRLQQDVRGAQGVRGFALESGVGSLDEIKQLTELRQALKTRRLNIALATAGRAPITGGTQTSQQTAFGPGQLVQNVTPGQVFGLASGTFGTQASIFGTQTGRNIAQTQQETVRRGQNLDFAGQFVPKVSFTF